MTRTQLRRMREAPRRREENRRRRTASCRDILARWEAQRIEREAERLTLKDAAAVTWASEPPRRGPLDWFADLLGIDR